MDQFILPSVIPTTVAPATTGYMDVTQVSLSNTTGADITVTIADMQPTPVLMLAIVVPGNTLLVTNWPNAYYCVGGITWVATGLGVTGHIRGRR